jgi:hypothetical protein
MTAYLLGWVIYGCGVLPTAMLLLWIARQEDSIEPWQEAPISILLALFWPAVLLVVLAGVVVGITHALRALVGDRAFWWAVGVRLTHPLYRLHMWCMTHFMLARAREKAAEQVSAKELRES